jgi:hypothetical protein
MTMEKTYDLKKAVSWSLILSAALTVIIYFASFTLVRFRETLLPDTGAAWYFWKLPAPELWATVSMWVLYAAHQVSVWYLIYKLSRCEYAPKGKISKLNMTLLLLNGAFIVLHIVQSMLFYDGLAQFVPVMSSQGSVIVMLVMVLVLMLPRRGLFFGKKVKLPQKGVALINKTHGYYIAWALVYTFWFHPTEGTLGHLMGFFYMFLLFAQMSLAKTSFHMDKRWITVLEVYVAVHGAIVAVGQGNGMWPMFLFGFLMMFIVTQLYGLTNKKPQIVAVTVIYAALAILVYSGVLGNPHTLADIHQITWIPIILYGLVFVLALVFWGVAEVRDKIRG